MPNINQLKDKFDYFDSSLWISRATPTYSNGNAIFEGSSVTRDDELTSKTGGYVLTNSSVQVELVDLNLEGEGSGEATMLDVTDDANEYYYALNIVNVVFGETTVNDLAVYRNIESGTGYDYGDEYNPSTDKYFRIKHSGSSIYFQKSQDGKTWVDIISPKSDTTLDTDAITLYMYINDIDGGYMTLNNLNIPPTPIEGTKYALPAFKIA